MSTVRRNTLANYAGQTWATVMSLMFMPIYIRYIGIEAYGIVGFFVALQSLFSILDMGFTATLNRELARRSGATSNSNDTRDLIRTLEWICWPIGFLIAIVVWVISRPLAEHWLKPVSLSLDQAAFALLLLGLSMALQWPVSFYTGGLSGLQRQVLLNVLTAAFGTLRAVGAVCVLWLISPTLEAFLWWQVAMSALQGVTYAAVTWMSLPGGSRAPSFKLAQLRQIGGFAVGITGVTIMSFLLTQTDRIVLSKILPLDEFGVYAFAASLSVALFRLVHPIVTAVYPRYSQLVAEESVDALIDFYHRTNQLMAAILLPVAAVVAVFATDLLRVWTRDPALAAASGPILSLLVIGSAMNGLMNLPYALQLSYGWTRLGFWINVVSVCLVVPGIWVMGRKFGGVGAASVWLALNLGYFLIGIPLMHRRLHPGEMWRWYRMDILPPLATCTMMVIAWRIALPNVPQGLPGWSLLFVIMATTGSASLAVSSYPRSILRAWWVNLRVIKK